MLITMIEVKRCLIIIKEWNSARDKIGGGSKVDSAFHHSEVDKVSTRNFWGLSGKK